jgi:hypothetical protein
MKKLLLFAFASAVSVCGYAQENIAIKSMSVNSAAATATNTIDLSGAKTTEVAGDTLYFASSKQTTTTDQLAPIYDFSLPNDSGKLYGINWRNLKAFAQLYRYSNIDQVAPADTPYRILGVVARFHGTKNASTTKQVVFNVWSQGTAKNPVTGLNKVYTYGYPNTSLGSKSVALSSITMGQFTVAYFSSPISGINKDVYVGYTIAYTWGSLGGDTIGLYSTNTVMQDLYTVESGTNDTLITPNRVTQESGNAWKSWQWDYRISGAGDQVIFPVIQFTCGNCWPTSVGGVQSNGMTFFGAYPNPAINNTNIKFSLDEAADVTINVMDVTGRVVSTINKNGLNKGESIVPIETANLTNGNYIYTVSTSKGGAVASQFTVAK